MNLQKRDCSFLYPLLLGAVAFFMVVGLAPLDPINAEWILGRLDPTQHYLGWLFYRNGPWAFPIGLNPTFGQDLSSSIVYSDSIPLLAIPFKALAPLLPERFHYFGIWIFACFLLQALLAWKILGLYTQTTILRILGCGLFIFFPPMLWRINTPAGGHAALVGHFLILWALYLILRPAQHKRTLLWVLVLCISLLTHFYIFAIVSLLWFVDLLNHLFVQRDINSRNFFNEIILIFICVLLLGWQAGYFSITASLNNDRGYGFYSMNVLGLIDPQGWSYLVENKTKPSSWGEGFAFIGSGAIIAGGLALLTLVKSSSGNHYQLYVFFKKRPYLGILIIFLTFFAISNRIGFGDHSHTFLLPNLISKAADTLRSSARLFWPIHYLLIIAFFVAIVRAFSKKLAIGILLICLVLQVIDTSKGWLNNREQLATKHSADAYKQNLSNSFWGDAGKHYRNLTLVPSSNRPPNWENFSLFALDYHLSTNAVHMARVDLAKEGASNARLNKIINMGLFNSDTLYIVENRFVIAALATADLNTQVAKIDNFNVIAPGWKECLDCPPINQKLILAKNQYATKLGEIIFFNESYPNRSYYLRSGWSWPENWGTWSDGKSAVLNFSWPLMPPKSMKLTFDAFLVGESHPAQEVEVIVNGEFYEKLTITQASNNHLDILFNTTMKHSKYLTIEFRLHNPARPVDLIENMPDNRTLGIGMKSAFFY